LGLGGHQMKRTVVGVLIFMVLLNSTVFAAETNIVSVGADLKKSEVENTLKSINIHEKTPQITITSEEQEKYMNDIVPLDKLKSKSVICTYMSVAGANEGIKVDLENITYVTPEMITEAMTTAGLKDVTVKVVSPYSTSGIFSMAYIVKSYEKLTGIAINDNAKTASNKELVILGDLSHKIGVQKALQFVNETKNNLIKTGDFEKNNISKNVEQQRLRFNIELDETETTNLIDLMSKIGMLNLKLEDISSQQKNIVQYINDFSHTTINRNIFSMIIDNILIFFKRISMIINKW
jgi:uncharacterized protein YpuA (DUF1002 family)